MATKSREGKRERERGGVFYNNPTTRKLGNQTKAFEITFSPPARLLILIRGWDKVGGGGVRRRVKEQRGVVWGRRRVWSSDRMFPGRNLT